MGLTLPGKAGSPVVARHDLRTFLLPGETLDTSGATSVHQVLQRAVDALGVAYAGDGVPRVVTVPAGRFRVSTAILWKPGVGIVGAGRTETVFAPQGAQSFIYGAFSLTVSYDDVIFTDFYVDCMGQTDTGPNFTVKAFYIQRMKRARFERVDVVGAWATGFGIDFLTDSWITDCRASNCGRGANSRIDTGAGFGFATGWSATESLTVQNCVSTGNYTHGFFIENSSRGSFSRTYGFRLIGCVATGNWTGFMDGGGLGTQIVGCSLTDNLYAGVLVTTNAASNHAGSEGRTSSTLLAKNGIGQGGAGVVIDAEGITWTVEGSDVLANRVGVLVSKASRVSVTGCTVADQTGSGVLVSSTAAVPGLRVVGNVFGRNGRLGTEPHRDGITLAAAMLLPTVRDNLFFDDQGSPTQAVAIAFRGAFTSTKPRVSGNDAAQDGQNIVVQHTVADSTLIVNNLVGYVPQPRLVTNRATNPSFEVATTGASTYRGALTRPTGQSPRSGSAVLRFTTNNAGWAWAQLPRLAVTAGETVTWSVWVRAAAGVIVAPYLFWTNNDYDRGTSIVGDGTWKRITMTAVTRTGFIDVACAIGRLAEGVATASDVIDLDDWMLTAGPDVYDWFDGANNGGAWTGTANASTSTKTITA